MIWQNTKKLHQIFSDVGDDEKRSTKNFVEEFLLATEKIGKTLPQDLVKQLDCSLDRRTPISPRGDLVSGSVIYRTSYFQITVMVGSELGYVLYATGVHSCHTLHTTLPKMGSLLAHCIGRRPNITALLGQCLMEIPAYLDLTPLPSPVCRTPFPLPSSVTAPPARYLHWSVKIWRGNV